MAGPASVPLLVEFLCYKSTKSTHFSNIIENNKKAKGNNQKPTMYRCWVRHFTYVVSSNSLSNPL